MKKLLFAAAFLFLTVSCNQQKTAEPESTPADTTIVAKDTVTVWIPFKNEADVRAYLCAHRYKDDEENIIYFADNANEIDFRDMPVAVSTTISEISDTSALIKGSGMLGESTIRFVAKKTGNLLEDVNDGVLYWEQH